MGFYADFIFRPRIFSVLLAFLGLLLFWFLPPFDHPALKIRSTSLPSPPRPESSVSLRPQIFKRPLHSRSTNLIVFVHYISTDFFPNDLYEYRILRLVLLRILGDPGAVSWAGRKGATKVFKHGRKSVWKRSSRLFSYGDDLPENLFKIIAQEPKKSTSGWHASLKIDAAFQIIYQQSLFKKNGKYCAPHHPQRILGSYWSPQIPWSWAIQWSKLLAL